MNAKPLQIFLLVCGPVFQFSNCIAQDSAVSGRSGVETVISDDGYLVYGYSAAEGGGFDLFLLNRQPFPLTVRTDFHGDNMSCTAVSPAVSILEGNEKVLLTSFVPVNKNANYTFYVDTYTFGFGKIDAKHDDDYVYSLPYSEDESCVICQGYDTRGTHQGAFKYSLDFYMPVGTGILASREGWVIMVEEEYPTTDTANHNDKVNYVFIVHDDGTYAQYSHCMQDGAIVSVGDYAEKGELIAFSGSSGTYSPHLHFSVHVPAGPPGSGNSYTVPTLFLTKDGEVRMLKEGDSY